jgi:hypothetical protein
VAAVGVRVIVWKALVLAALIGATVLVGTSL